MKAFHIGSALVIALICSLSAKTPVKVTNEKIWVFENSDIEYIRDSLYKGDEAFLLQETAKLAKIKMKSGVVGWVQKKDIEFIKVSLGDSYQLNNQDIIGWLDNPQAMYILDHNLDGEALLLTRSFEAEIFEFIDREILERSNEEN